MLTSLLTDPRGALLQIVLMLPALIVGFTLHEFCHAAVAVRMGDNTPRIQGRVTLNPAAHIDWMGMLFFALLGWGYAKPVQVNARNFKSVRWGDTLVSLAGPLSNLFLAALCFCLFGLLPTGLWSDFLWMGCSVNLTLCFLNLLPIPPLDGYRVLRSWLPYQATLPLLRVERYGVFLLLLLSFTGLLGRYLSFCQVGMFQLFSHLL